MKGAMRTGVIIVEEVEGVPRAFDKGEQATGVQAEQADELAGGKTAAGLLSGRIRPASAVLLGIGHGKSGPIDQPHGASVPLAPEARLKPPGQGVEQSLQPRHGQGGACLAIGTRGILGRAPPLGGRVGLQATERPTAAGAAGENLAEEGPKDLNPGKLPAAAAGALFGRHEKAGKEAPEKSGQADERLGGRGRAPGLGAHWGALGAQEREIRRRVFHRPYLYGPT